MKLREIYETAVRMGIEADPRGKEGVDEFLARTKKRVRRLPDHLKELADPEELTNPFNDTRIYVGDPDTEVTTLLGGIDMNTGEVLLADRLREKGTPIDAIYTHHPEGWGLTKLDSVMEVQADIWADAGRAHPGRREAHRRAHGRGPPAPHAGQLRPGHRRGAPARRAVLLGAHAHRQPRGRLPQQVLRQEEAEHHRGRAEGAARDPRVPHRRAEGRRPVHRQEQPAGRAPARSGST